MGQVKSCVHEQPQQRASARLGKSTNFVANGSQSGASASPQEAAARAARRLRSALQGVARRLLPEDKGLQACMRLPAPGAGYVETITHPGTRTGSVRGVCRCGNVHRCLVCAAQVSEVKRAELQAAVTRCLANGGAVYLVTYTFSHKAGNDLQATLEAFSLARRKMRQQRSYREARAKFGNPTPVVALECTWSPWYGWHPHVHELLFVLDTSQQVMTPEEFEQVTRVEWERAAVKCGLTMNEHGIDFRQTAGAIADYLAKWGHEPEQRPWGTEDELAKAYAKQGHLVISRRHNLHLGPFQMLRLIYEGIERVGNYELGTLWREYAFAMVGKPQLRWGPGLRKALGLDEEQSDEEIVTQASTDPGYTLGLIPVADWSMVVGNDAVADLNEEVGTGDFERVRSWLTGLGVRYLRPEAVFSKRDVAVEDGPPPGG